MVNPLWPLLIVAAIGWVVFLLQRFVSRRLDKTTAAFQSKFDDMAQLSSTLFERLPPSVFLKPVGDEAALALNWTSAMAALMHAASTLLFLLLQWVRDHWNRAPRMLRIIGGVLLSAAWALGTFGLLWTLAVYHPLPYALERIREDLGGNVLLLRISLFWALFTGAASLVMVLAFFAVLLVALLAAVGAGMPSVKTALYCQISVEPIPVGNHRLVLVDVSSPPSLASTHLAPGGLSHSALYNSPGAIHAVIEALEGFETARATASQSVRNLGAIDC